MVFISSASQAASQCREAELPSRGSRQVSWHVCSPSLLHVRNRAGPLSPLRVEFAKDRKSEVPTKSFPGITQLGRFSGWPARAVVRCWRTLAPGHCGRIWPTNNSPCPFALLPYFAFLKVKRRESLPALALISLGRAFLPGCATQMVNVSL